MSTKQYGNLTQITRLIAFNSYIVREDDGLTVVDTNLPDSADLIKATADQLGLPIRRIVVTHAHMDHVASVDALHALVPEAEFIASARTAQFLRGEKELLPGEPVDELRGGYTAIETQPTRLVAEGENIGSLRVVASPGHTPGHIALFDERDGMLIAGDALQTQWGTVVSGKWNWLFPLPAMATWHKQTALQTAQKLRELKPSQLAVGHGPVLTKPLPALDKAIQEAEKAFARR